MDSAIDVGSESDFEGDAPQSKVFVLSARDERAVQLMATNLKEYLQKMQSTIGNESAFLDNLAYTLGARRSRFPWVSTFSGDSISGLIKTLDSGRFKTAKSSTTAPRLGFVFTGQGAQWWAMGRELIDAYPVFKATLLGCDAQLKKLGSTWDMIGMLTSCDEMGAHVIVTNRMLQRNSTATPSRATSTSSTTAPPYVSQFRSPWFISCALGVSHPPR